MIRKKIAALVMAAFVSVSSAAMSASAIGLGNSGNFTYFESINDVQYKAYDGYTAEIGGTKAKVNFKVTSSMNDGSYFFSAAQVEDIKAERAVSDLISSDEYDYYDIVDVEICDRKKLPQYPFMFISISSERAIGYNCVYIVNEDYSLYKSKLYRYVDGEKNAAVFENYGKTRFVLMKLKEDVDVEYLDEDIIGPDVPIPSPMPTPVPTPKPYPHTDPIYTKDDSDDSKTINSGGSVTDASKVLPIGEETDPKDIQNSANSPDEGSVTEVSDGETSEITEVSIEDSKISEVSEISGNSQNSEKSQGSGSDAQTSALQPDKDGVKTGDTAPAAAVFAVVGAAALLTGISVSKKKKTE